MDGRNKKERKERRKEGIKGRINEGKKGCVGEKKEIIKEGQWTGGKEK